MAQQPRRELVKDTNSIQVISKAQLPSEEFEKVCGAIFSGYSCLILAETGAGAEEFAQAVHEHFQAERDCAIATWQGSQPKFFGTIAEQLGCPLENEQGKRLSAELLKEEIALNAPEGTLFIFPEAKRLSAGIRYWLENLMEQGVQLCCFAVANPNKDIFLKMLEIELPLPSDQHIRRVMASEAQREGLQLSNTRLAELQPLAGRNPLLAKKVIRNEKLGIRQAKPEHTQYVVIMPIILSAMMAFGIIRFIGLGTNNRAMYIFGGTSLVLGTTLQRLGSIRGARKRLGQ